MVDWGLGVVLPSRSLHHLLVEYLARVGWAELCEAQHITTTNRIELTWCFLNGLLGFALLCANLLKMWGCLLGFIAFSANLRVSAQATRASFCAKLWAVLFIIVIAFPTLVYDIIAYSPIFWQDAGFNILVDAGIWPIASLCDIAMFNGVVVNVVNMPLHV